MCSGFDQLCVDFVWKAKRQQRVVAASLKLFVFVHCGDDQFSFSKVVHRSVSYLRFAEPNIDAWQLDQLPGAKDPTRPSTANKLHNVELSP